MNKDSFSRIKLKFIPEGKPVKVRRLKEGHIPEVTEFNFALVNSGKLFNHLRSKSLPVSRRRRRSTPGFRVLAYEHPRVVGPALKEITRLANLPGQPYKSPQKRFLYQQALGEICSLMAQESWQEGIEGTLGLLMERGALLTGAFYNYPDDYLARVVAKRLDYESGELGLGFSNFTLPKDVKRFRKLHIQEDCIATGDSIAGITLVLKKKGLVFDEVQIDAVVVVQTGAEFLIKFLKNLGVKKIKIKAGGLCFKLDDHFYLRRTRQEGYKEDEFYVGDMGEWGRKLPESFNKLAWWNKNRVDF